MQLLLSAGQRLPEENTRAAIGPTVPLLKRRVQPVLDPLLVLRVLRRERPDVYHATEWAQPLVNVVPVAVTVHDLIPFLFREGYTWMRRERLLALRLVRRADAVIAVSQSTAEDVVRLARVDPGRITVIPHGVDAHFHPAPAEDVERVHRDQRITRPYLLSVGTLDPRKGLDALVEVTAQVRREHDVELVIAGDQGVYGGRVRAAVQAAGLGSVSRLTGFVGAEELVALYTGATCLLFPSAYEGFGLPVLEAMACGSVAVTFDNSAFPEVAGDAGVMVPDGDRQAMAQAVSGLLGDREERRRRSEIGRAWAAGFTWERSAQAHLDVYTRLAR
jgi:glycosyltransferase involved in cell wall biosynthesis